MTDEHPLVDCRAEIDRRLSAALEPASGTGIPVAREAVERWDDRWYGRLLVRSYDSVSDSASADAEAVLSAAAAIELLRGYCRLRSELLVWVADGGSDSAPQNPTSALLAADRLFSAAYAELGGIDHRRAEACFETLADVSKRIVEAFAVSYGESAVPGTSRRALIDDTTGALGEGAAVIGVILGGGGSHRDRFATLGRSFGASRQVRRTLDSDAGSIRVATEPDGRQLRGHAERRLAEADRALCELSSVCDATRLRPLYEELDSSRT